MQKGVQSLSQVSAEPWVSSGWGPLPRRLGPGGAWAGNERRQEGWCPDTHRCVQSSPSSGGSGSLCVLIWEAAEEEVTRPRVGEGFGGSGGDRSRRRWSR